MSRPFHGEGAPQEAQVNPLRPADLLEDPRIASGLPSQQPDGSPVSGPGFGASHETGDVPHPYGAPAEAGRSLTLAEHGQAAVAEWVQRSRLGRIVVTAVGLASRAGHTKSRMAAAARVRLENADDVLGIIESGGGAVVPALQSATSARAVRRSGAKADKLASKVDGIQQQLEHEREEQRLGHAEGNFSRTLQGLLIGRLHQGALRRAQARQGDSAAKHAARQARHDNNEARLGRHTARIDEYKTRIRSRTGK